VNNTSVQTTSRSITLFKSETEYLHFDETKNVGLLVFLVKDDKGKMIPGTLSVYQIGYVEHLNVKKDQMILNNPNPLNPNVVIKVLSIPTEKLNQNSVESLLVDGDFAEKLLTELINFNEEIKS